MGRKRIDRRLKIVHSHCAGIDIGKSKHYVAVDPDYADNGWVYLAYAHTHKEGEGRNKPAMTE